MVILRTLHVQEWVFRGVHMLAYAPR